jgi:hypothetical protein
MTSICQYVASLCLPHYSYSQQVFKMWNKGTHTFGLIRQNRYMHRTDRNYSLRCHLCGTAHWSTPNATACEHYGSVPRLRIFLHQAWNDKKQETMQCSYLWLNPHCNHCDKHTGMGGQPVLFVQKHEEIYNFKNPNYSNSQWRENTGEETDTLQFITPHTYFTTIAKHNTQEELMYHKQ